jgi:hypothetical protein
MDLPRPGDSSSSTQTNAGMASAGFRPISQSWQSEGPSAGSVAANTSSAVEGQVRPAQFTSQANYAYDPEYRWVRGRLEYSQIDRQWKLRYIPIDAETDDFGGSVILPDPDALSGCERGDFLEIHGQLGKRDAEEGYAPVYQVAEVKRLSGSVQ